MKKVFLAVAIVAAMGVFTSCGDKDKVTCWEVKQNLTGIVLEYVWGTKAEAEAKYPMGVKISKVSKSEADCKGGFMDI